jgi:3-methyladenine DNA glycosylase AlkD
MSRPGTKATPNGNVEEIKRELALLADPAKAKVLQGFFKTGPGQYGEGDIFLGVGVPLLRRLVAKYAMLDLPDISALLRSPVHEERFVGLLMLIQAYRKGDDAERKGIFNCYLGHTRWINSWDLVDLSAEHIVGHFLMERSKERLYRLARSEMLWERRIAMVATFHYIKAGEPDETLKVARMLIGDRHDLIQKAVGWMLREVGKRCSEEIEGAFLKEHYRAMGRTALRYAIERFTPEKRRAWLAGDIG